MMSEKDKRGSIRNHNRLIADDKINLPLILGDFPCRFRKSMFRISASTPSKTSTVVTSPEGARSYLTLIAGSIGRPSVDGPGALQPTARFVRAQLESNACSSTHPALLPPPPCLQLIRDRPRKTPNQTEVRSCRFCAWQLSDPRPEFSNNVPPGLHYLPPLDPRSEEFVELFRSFLWSKDERTNILALAEPDARLFIELIDRVCSF